MNTHHHKLDRRGFLEASLAGGATVSGLGALPQGAIAADPSQAKSHVYTGAMSCCPGESLPVHVSTGLRRFNVTVDRIGLDRSIIWSRSDIAGAEHPIPADASLYGCKWPETFSIPIDGSWRSGVYRLRLHADENTTQRVTETFFIVRAADTGSKSRILFQLSTNTYQAYNMWGGSSLYSGPTFPRVSFDRPFNITPPVTEHVDGFYNPNDACYHTWDEPFILWAEQSGYEIDYCANLDLELYPDLLQRYRLVLSLGHDEYWSAGMRDQLEAFIARGGNAAFLSGNSVFWQVRVEDQGRALVCYKLAHDKDPVFATSDRRTLSTMWSDPLLGRPENQLTGVGFAYGGYNGFFGEHLSGFGAGEYTVHQPDHWLFRGTGLQRGETFGRLTAGPQPGIAGYECDGCEYIFRNDIPVPTGRDGSPQNLEILATAPAKWSDRDGTRGWAEAVRNALPQGSDPHLAGVDPPTSGVMGIYERGGTVVTVGSCGWAYGLQARDHVVDRIVRNMLDRLSV